MKGSCGQTARDRRKPISMREAEEYGFRINGNADCSNFGPVSPMKGQLEIERIARITESIKLRGYLSDSSEDCVTGWLLVTDRRDWAFVIAGGQQPAAVKAAVGADSIPVLISPQRLVSRSDVYRWPGVRTGSLTSSGAIKVFDRIFSRQLPAVVRDGWPPEREPARPATVTYNNVRRTPPLYDTCS